MVSLTENLVLSKSRTDSLDHVRQLNLWGNDLTDVSILQRMPNVEILALSVNRISSLRDFQYCTKLTELYLRKNEISDLSELYLLQNLPNLKILWLSDNPCAEQQNYRMFVVKTLPNLVKLDNADITAEEKLAAEMAHFPEFEEKKIVLNEPKKSPVVSRPSTHQQPHPSRHGNASSEAPVKSRQHSHSHSSVLHAITILLDELNLEELQVLQGVINERVPPSSAPKSRSRQHY